MKFPLRSFLVNGKKTPQLSVDLFTFTKKILNGQAARMESEQ